MTASKNPAEMTNKEILNGIAELLDPLKGAIGVMEARVTVREDRRVDTTI
jgi:hypothetical protein